MQHIPSRRGRNQEQFEIDHEEDGRDLLTAIRLPIGGDIYSGTSLQDDLEFGELQEYFDFQHNLSRSVDIADPPLRNIPIDDNRYFYCDDEEQYRDDLEGSFTDNHDYGGDNFDPNGANAVDVTSVGNVHNESLDPCGEGVQNYLEGIPSDDILNISVNSSDEMAVRRARRRLGHSPRSHHRGRLRETNRFEFSDDIDDNIEWDELSPMMQQQNRRIKRLRLLLQIGRQSKTVFVGFLFLYIIYLQISSHVTNNWEKSRLNGFSESGVCISPSAAYDIVQFNTFSWEDGRIDIDDFISTVYKPVAYRTDDDNTNTKYLLDKDSLCITAARIEKCSSVLESVQVGENLLEFKSLFNSYGKRSYFPFVTVLNVLCVIALAITILFEADEKCVNFLTSSTWQCSQHINRRTFECVNVMIVLTIGVLCIVGSFSYRKIYDEDCREVYRDISTRDSFCDVIESCGLGLSSIIEPDDKLVQNYFFISMVLGILIIFCVVFRYILPIKIPYVGILPVEGIEEGSDIINISSEISVVDDDSPSNFGDDQLFSLEPQASHPGTNAINLMLALGDGSLWIPIPIDESDKMDDECTICLSDFKLSTSHDQQVHKDGNDCAHVFANKDEGLMSETVVKLSKCDHKFHRKCIIEWLEQENHTCPICRAPML